MNHNKILNHIKSKGNYVELRYRHDLSDYSYTFFIHIADNGELLITFSLDYNSSELASYIHNTLIKPFGILLTCKFDGDCYEWVYVVKEWNKIPLLLSLSSDEWVIEYEHI